MRLNSPKLRVPLPFVEGAWRHLVCEGVSNAQKRACAASSLGSEHTVQRIYKGCGEVVGRGAVGGRPFSHVASVVER